MSEQGNIHPSPEKLRAFTLGQVDVEELDRIGHHLAECSTCCELLDKLQARDALVQTLHAAVSPKTMIPENPQERRQAVQSVHLTSIRSRPTNTLLPEAQQSGRADRSPSIVTLLSPPRGSGELGWLAHYRVLEVLGQGGMGVVLRAEDTQLQRTVALKVILPDLAAESLARERFLREARSCAALKNDHVVTIYQVGQDRDLPFLAMEFLQGQTLETRLHREPSLPLLEVLRIAREALTGLAAVHAHGLIHRDIKPANIWLEAPTGKVKLLDFGLARTGGSRSHLTRTGEVSGTPDFMSPEQARGQTVDARSDLFSLGVVLYTMCSGQKPFRGDTVTAVLTALAVDTPRPVDEFNPAMPTGLTKLIERLLEKVPAHRPATAAEVLTALDTIKDGEESSASKTFPHTRPPHSAHPTTRRSLRWLMLGGLVGVAVLLGTIGFLAGWFDGGPSVNPMPKPEGPPLRIGLLHSRTGTMALSERPIVDAVLMAIEEINAQGGVLGRPIEAVVADGKSDETVFAREAERLIVEEKVCTIFGCWTSASRKAVVTVVERHDHLLFFPLGSEGGEQSPNVVYLGPVPNQRILPPLRWLVGFAGKRKWFLVGSDYVFPVMANAVIRDEAEVLGCEVVGEEYLLLGSTRVSEVVKKIRQAKPDLIVSTINGDTNVAFYRELRQAGVSSRDIPLLSISISEGELNALGPRLTAGDYLSASYFQSLDLPQNRDFLARFRKRYGEERQVSSPMATAYTGVYLWAKRVEAAKRDNPGAIRKAIQGQTYESPFGSVWIDPTTQHTVQTARVGQLREEGPIVVVYASPKPIQPEPFPRSRTRQEWLMLLDSLQKRWGGRWSNPGP